MKEIIEKAEQSHNLTVPQIEKLLKFHCFDADLFAAADRVRSQYKGDKIKIWGLFEFSNLCSNDCLYCGLRKSNSKIERYRADKTDFLEMAHQARECGLKTLVLQSGEFNCNLTSRTEDNSGPYSFLKEILPELRRLGFKVILSCGNASRFDYRAFAKNGVKGYLMRIETTDKKLFNKMHPYQDWHTRDDQLHIINNYGFYLATGNLVGLPGQSLQSIAKDLLYIKELSAEMIGIGGFIPHQETPLKDYPKADVNLVLKCMAISRLLNPESDIVAATSLETLAPEAQKLGMECGGNLVMTNVTAPWLRGKYEIFDGKSTAGADLKNGLSELTAKIESWGRVVSPVFEK